MYTLMKNSAAERLGLIPVVAAVFGLCSLSLRYQPAENVSPGVLAWWVALCAISIFNIDLWRRSAAALARRKADLDPKVYRFQRWQLLLSAAYVLGCAFRSILPRADVQRIGLFDSWVSSVLVGRSVATVAELCFAAQMALLLRMIARDANCRIGNAISWLLVPLIVAAEICSWYGVLTTAYLGNAIEESIWALAALMLIAGFVAVWQSCKSAFRPFLAVAMALGMGYVVFMCTVDVPMYVSRWLTDETNGREYLSLSQGLWDAGSRWKVTHTWDEWHPEIPWMSLYFSVGVWCSLALVHVPRFGRGTPPMDPSLALRANDYAACAPG
jgi:hypothetical protein